MKIFLAVHERKRQQVWYIEVSDDTAPVYGKRSATIHEFPKTGLTASAQIWDALAFLRSPTYYVQSTLVFYVKTLWYFKSHHNLQHQMAHQVQPGPSKKRCPASTAKNEQLRCARAKRLDKESHAPDNVSLPRKLSAKVKVLKVTHSCITGRSCCNHGEARGNNSNNSHFRRNPRCT